MSLARQAITSGRAKTKLEELIARDAEEYVEIALRVARDRVYREALSSRIRDGLPRLVDRSEPIEALVNALERMAGGQG